MVVSIRIVTGGINYKQTETGVVVDWKQKNTVTII